jgi:hypothetical protein
VDKDFQEDCHGLFEDTIPANEENRETSQPGYLVT